MDYLTTETWKEINETPEILGNIRSVNEKTMAELLKIIKNGSATNFIVAARGASNNAVTFFKYVLEINSKYTVGFSAPSVITLYRGKIDYSNSIILGCSFSGQAEDVLEVLKKGNEQGAVTVAVTNNPNSPVGSEAKFVLNCNAGEEISAMATKSFNSQLYILSWLAFELAGMKNELFLLKNIKGELRHCLDQIDSLTTKYADKFKDMKSGFIVSRGLSYAVALEMAHAIQTTSQLNVKGYPGSEFYHGPLSMVNKDTPVILLCAQYYADEEMRSIIRADQIKMIEKMLGFNAPVLLVTNDSLIRDRFKRCNDAFINVSLPEELTVFAFSLFAQMFTCKLVCNKGVNPDCQTPEQKITITK